MDSDASEGGDHEDTFDVDLTPAYSPPEFTTMFEWLGPPHLPQVATNANFETEFSETDNPAPGWRVLLGWRLVDGRYEPATLEIISDRANRAPLNATLLRKLPMGYLIEEGRRGQIQSLQWWRDVLNELSNPSEEMGDSYVGGIGGEYVLEAIPAQLEVFQNPARRRRYDDEHWTRVATVYDHAWATGSAPTKAVAESFEVTRSTAAKWVAICRTMDLLPPTEKTKPRGNPVKGGADGVGTED